LNSKPLKGECNNEAPQYLVNPQEEDDDNKNLPMPIRVYHAAQDMVRESKAADSKLQEEADIFAAQKASVEQMIKLSLRPFAVEDVDSTSSKLLRLLDGHIQKRQE
jgi:5-bromo-4-chloroindolyl phosphate hydrolysis protein